MKRNVKLVIYVVFILKQHHFLPLKNHHLKKHMKIFLKKIVIVLLKNLLKNCQRNNFKNKKGIVQNLKRQTQTR